MEEIIMYLILIIVSILSIITWYKKIDKETAYIYAIYCLFIIILFSIVLYFD